MKVKLLEQNQTYQIQTLYVAARTCKSESTPEGIWEDAWKVHRNDKIKLLKALWKAGHYSVFEHVNVTYAISGISRACLAQLSRHRFLSMSVQSQRYVKTDLWQALRLEGNPPKQTVVVIPPSFGEKGREIYLDALHQVVKACDELTGLGVPLEDIRYLYPGGRALFLPSPCPLSIRSPEHTRPVPSWSCPPCVPWPCRPCFSPS